MRSALGASKDSLKRSINLALSERGLAALRAGGLAEVAVSDAVKMPHRVVHAPSGAVSTLPYGTHGECVYSVSRGGLNATLLDALDREANVSVRFDVTVMRTDLVEGGVDVHVKAGGGGAREVIEARLVVGADGAFSKVRDVVLRSGPVDFSRVFMSRVYKELALEPSSSGDFALPLPEGLHIWGRGDTMLIALPNKDRTFTCTLFATRPFFAELDVLSDDALLCRLTALFPDVIPLMPDATAQFRENPIGALMTVRVNPWNIDSRVVLVGDAAHAVVPFYGQGMNAAFEDALELAKALTASGFDWDVAIPRFAAARRVDTDALADLSLENEVEMRAKSKSTAFVAQKRVEALLHAVFPAWWIPQYTMIAFTRMPYSEAYSRAKRQDAAIQTIATTTFSAIVGIAALAATFFFLSHAKKR